MQHFLYFTPYSHNNLYDLCYTMLPHTQPLFMYEYNFAKCEFNSQYAKLI